MKRLLAILLFAASCFSARADFTTITLTVTNTPTNGYTVTINGNVRTWTNSVFNAGTQIANTNSIGAAATNLLFQLISRGIDGVRFTPNGTNAIDMLSFSTLTVSVSTNWASLSTTNVTTTNGLGVIVPLEEYYPTNRNRVASQLVKGINDYATNWFDVTALALTNFLGLSSTQTVTGPKILNGANTYSNSAQIFSGGQITNATLSNCVPALTNGYATNLRLTNGQNYGQPFRSPGGGTASEQFGVNASASQDDSIAIGDNSAASAVGAIAIGTSAAASGAQSIAIGSLIGATGSPSIVIGYEAHASGNFSTAIGAGDGITFDGADAAHDYSTAIGYGVTTTKTNQVRIGTSAEYVSIPGGLAVEGGITNIHAIGTNTWDGDLSFIRKNNTSLANGNNAGVSVSTNFYVKVSGPSGAFAINGIAGGRDGRMIILQNSTGFTLTIANDSGVDPVAANRILTGTGSDITQANNPGCVTLIYDSAASRWVVVNQN